MINACIAVGSGRPREERPLEHVVVRAHEQVERELDGHRELQPRELQRVHHQGVHLHAAGLDERLVRRAQVGDPRGVEEQLLLGEQRGAVAGPAEVEVAEDLGDRLGRREPPVLRLEGGDGALGRRVLLGDALLDQREHQGVLVGEVGVEGAAGEAGGLADLLHAGADHAASGEDGEGGGHQALARPGPARAERGDRRRRRCGGRLGERRHGDHSSARCIHSCIAYSHVSR